MPETTQLLEVALQFYKNGDLDSAKKNYLSVLQIDKKNSSAHHFIGIILLQQDKVNDALQHLKTAVELCPRNPGMHYGLGLCYQEANETSLAIEHIEKSLSYEPQHEIRLLKIVCLLANDSQWEKAKKYCEKLLTINNQNPEAHCYFAFILEHESKLFEAADHYQYAIDIMPNYHDASQQLAMLLRRQYQHEKAIACLDKALTHHPSSSQTLYNLAVLYHDTDMPEEALHYYHRAIDCDNNNYQAYSDLAELLFYQDNINDAITYYTTALSLQPNDTTILSRLAHAYRSIGLWDKASDITNKVLVRTQETVSDADLGITPLTALEMNFSPELQQTIAKKYADHYDIYDGKKCFTHKKKPTDKLNIGYVSPDFSDHSIGFLLNNLFSHHDRENFTIFGFTLTKIEQGCSTPLIDSFDHIIDISELDVDSAALCIYQHDIHILMDLTGYTAHNKTEIFSLQPAPIQCHAFGYTGTLGAKYMQYHFSHKAMMPEQAAKFYNEDIVYFPDTPFALQPLPDPKIPLKRSDFNLPDDVFIFCYLNDTARIDASVFSAWMAILQAVEHSVLWLRETNHSFVEQLKIKSAEFGIDNSRLIFSPAEKLSKRWYHTLADLWLDTFTISCGTAGIICASSGLPLLTLAGKHAQTCTGSGIAVGINMPDMIAYSVEEYQLKAIDLGNHPDKMREVKERLLEEHVKCPFFKPKDYVQNIEKAYHVMWDRYYFDKPSGPIWL